MTAKRDPLRLGRGPTHRGSYRPRAREADRLAREQPPPPGPPRVAPTQPPAGVIARELLGGRVIR